MMSARGFGRNALRLLARLALGALVILGGFTVAGVGLVLHIVGVLTLKDYIEGHPRFSPITPELRSLLSEFERTARGLAVGATANVALPRIKDGGQIYLVDAATGHGSRTEWPGPRDLRRVSLWTGTGIGTGSDPGPNATGVVHFQGGQLVGFATANPCDLSVDNAPMLQAQRRFARVECRPPQWSFRWHECRPQWNPACTLVVVGAE